VDANFANAQYFASELEKRSDKFELLFEPECTQVCFFYLPKCIRGMPKSKGRDEICGQFVPMLRRRIQVAGSMLVNYNPLSESLPNFPFVPNHWRIVWANPEQTFKDALFVLDEMDRLGEDMVLPTGNGAVHTA